MVLDGDVVLGGHPEQGPENGEVHEPVIQKPVDEHENRHLGKKDSQPVQGSQALALGAL